MRFSVCAKAGGSVANQPGFDLGGFAIEVVEVIAGKIEDWQTLEDRVTITLDTEKQNNQITIKNNIFEPEAGQLPTEPMENTAGRVVRFALDYLNGRGADFDYDLQIEIDKGLSIKGTGLGSSGATIAAAYKALEGVFVKLDLSFEIPDEVLINIFKEADFGVPDNGIPSCFGGLTLINKNEIKKVIPHPEFGYFVLVTPSGFGIKTVDARKVLEGKKAPENTEVLTSEMIRAIQGGDARLYGRLMEECHEWFVSPRSRLYPQDGLIFEEVRETACQEGAFGTTISGAGPTIMSIIDSQKDGKKIGLAMYKKMQELGYDSVVRLVKINNNGAVFC